MFRRAAAEDVPALVRLVNEAYVVEREFIACDRTTEDEVRGMLTRGDFLTTQDRSGCVYVELRGERAYFGMLAVAPARQKTGLGGRLVAAAEEHARAAGCRIMDIRVVDLRQDLFPFYRRLGYVETGSAPFEDPVLVATGAVHRDVQVAG